MEKVRVHLTKTELAHIIGGLYVTASHSIDYAEHTRELYRRLRKIQDRAGW